MKDRRKMDGFEDLAAGGEGVGALENIAEAGGVKGSELKERKRKKRKKRAEEDADDGRERKRRAAS